MLTIKVYKRRFIYPIFAGQMDKVVSAYPNNIQNVCYDSIFGNVEVMNIITLVCFSHTKCSFLSVILNYLFATTRNHSLAKSKIHKRKRQTKLQKKN